MKHRLTCALTRHLRLTSGRILVVVVLVCLSAPSVIAQRARPDRPYQGLFGGNGMDPKSTQQLDLNLSLFGGYDDNVLMEQGSYVDPRFQQDGGYAGGSVSLDYTKKVERVFFDFSGGTAYRYYPSVSEMTGFNSWGSVGLSYRMTPKATLRLSESVSYSPFYSFGTFPGLSPGTPGQIVPINPNYPLFEQPAISWYSSASYDYRMTPRSTVSADYSYSSTNYRNQDLQYRDWRAGGLYSYRLNTQASLRLGYHFRRGYSGLYYGGQPYDSHDIDVGLDYSKALSLSRRTTFGFSVSPAITKSVPVNGTATAGNYQYETRYRLNASAFLNRQIARSWSASLNYQRMTEYVQGFANPFFTDTVTANISGFIDQRSRFGANTGYTRGQAAYTSSSGVYNTYFAAANYQFALTKWLALYADYNFYHYLFDQGILLPPGMNRGQDRNSVHAGINLWAPLLR